MGRRFAAAISINYHLFGDFDLFRCRCKAFAGAQYNDGAILSVLGEGAPVLWDHVAWWLVSFDDYYRFCGDKLFLRKHKESIIKDANWLAGKAGRSGLVNIPKNTTRSWMCIYPTRQVKAQRSMRYTIAQ